MKKSFKLKTYINNNIKIGDKIKIIDGSGLSSTMSDDNKDYYIIFSYPDYTKSNLNLKEIIGTVVQTNITDYILISNNDYAYLQDIVIELGEGRFRTCSAFLKPV